MRRHPVKVVFGAVPLLFWVVVCVLLLEWGERFVTRTGVVDGYASPIISLAEKQDLDVYEATRATAPRPPADVAAKYPALDALDNATETGLGDLAGQWEGIIFQCDLKGNINKRYAATGAQLAAQLAAKTAGAANVSEVLSGEHPDYGRDVLFRLERAVEDWRNPRPPLPHMVGCLGPCVDYMIPLPDIPHAGFRFMFHPFLAPGQADPKVFVVVAPWRWQAFVGGFRPNYYECDAYPQFPKSEFWTNSRGFRDGEIAVPKPKGVYRIVCIGGSTALEGPRNDLTFPKMLQQLLRAYFRTDAIEVVNCGVDGGTIRGQVGRFADCLALNPDLVIHYNFVNDTHDLIDNVLKSTVIRTAWRRGLMGTLSQSQFLARRCRRLWSVVMPRESDYRDEIEGFIMPSLRELCERTQQSGARFAVASFAYPDLYNLPAKERAWFRGHFWFNQIVQTQFDDYVLAANAFNDLARSFCEREGALYVPVAEEIKGGLDTFTDHCHMHIAGIRHKAQIMFDHLNDVIAKDLEASKLPASSSPP